MVNSGEVSLADTNIILEFQDELMQAIGDKLKVKSDHVPKDPLQALLGGMR